MPKTIQSLASNNTLGNISNVLNNYSAIYNTLDGTSSDFLGINEQNPCTATLAQIEFVRIKVYSWVFRFH